MSQSGPLGRPPTVSIECIADHPTDASGFVRLRQVELVNRYADGRRSEPYRYFMVERALLDAVVIVLFRKTDGGPQVLLRSQLRPPLAFRKAYEVPIGAAGTGAVQWELPAGLIERGELGMAGIFGRASAEAYEEAGFRLAPERFSQLGLPTSLSPGLIAEKLHFAYAELTDRDAQEEPPGDGHAVEEASVCRFVSLEEALAAVESGLVHDIKTELGLLRLKARLLGAAE